MHDIPVVFHFKVEFDALETSGSSSDDEDIRFQEVGGLTAEVSTEELREGGLNEYAHRIPTGAKYGNLVLRELPPDQAAAALPDVWQDPISAAERSMQLNRIIDDLNKTR